MRSRLVQGETRSLDFRRSGWQHEATSLDVMTLTDDLHD
jgi:hypothetical protein